LFKIPKLASVVHKLDMPHVKSGSGIPTVGRIPVTMPIFMQTDIIMYDVNPTPIICSNGAGI
jgi:hypothetical protein